MRIGSSSWVERERLEAEAKASAATRRAGSRLDSE